MYFLPHFLIWSLLWLNIIIIVNLVELPKGLEIWSFSQVPVHENVQELEFWLKIYIVSFSVVSAKASC